MTTRNIPVLSLNNPLSIDAELTGVGWNLPTDMTAEQWAEAGAMLAKLDQSKQWWVGDWWNAVNYGTGQEVCDDVGINYTTAADCGAVAKDFDFTRRRVNLSFSHHKELRPIDDKSVQDRFLDWSENGKKSVRELREQVRKYLDEQGWSKEDKKRRDFVKSGGTITINKKTDDKLRQWAEFEGLFVPIDRGSPWGNPFVLDEDGDRDTVCNSYGVYIDLKYSLVKRVNELQGKVLACWCYPKRCHGDELIRRINNES